MAATHNDQVSEGAASESQRGLPAGIAYSRLLDCVADPVLIISANTCVAWLNAAARELDDWLKADDPARSLESELRPTMPAARALTNASGDHKTMTLLLKKRSGEERSYRAVILDAAADAGDNLTGCVLVKTSGASLKDSLFDPRRTPKSRARDWKKCSGNCCRPTGFPRSDSSPPAWLTRSTIRSVTSSPTSSR